MRCTFARYPHVPAACQGDDDQSQIQVFNITLTAERQVEVVLNFLEKRFGGYVQLWETHESL